MARSEDDPRNPGQTRTEIQLDTVREPILGDSPVNPGTEPHTTPALTTTDRRKTAPGPAAAAGPVVYDDRKQTATDPHAPRSNAGAAAEEVDVAESVGKLLESVEPRRADTGTMGASGEHARLPHRER